MSLAAAPIYWLIIAVWLAVLVMVGLAYRRNPKTFGTTRLLLAVVAIDAVRSVVENLYFGSQYGLFEKEVVTVLGIPHLLVLPTVLNLIAAIFVLGLILMRWLPTASREGAAEQVNQPSAALMQEMEEHRRLFETSSDLIAVIDADRIIRRISNSCLAILGYRPEEMIGRHVGDFIGERDFPLLQRTMQVVQDGRLIQDIEVEFRHRDGRMVTIALGGVWSDAAQRFFLIGRDMTERRAAEERLSYMAHFDQLTGLPNRTRIIMDIDALLAERQDGQGSELAIAILDLEGFKDFNDTLGGSTGDRLLKVFSKRLTETVAGKGRVSRFGGDEFLLLLPGLTSEAVEAIVGLALERIREPVEIEDQRLFLSASAGIAIAPPDALEAGALISNAGLALHDAKSAGGGKCRLYVPEMRARAEARQLLETELRRACAEREFVLYYQPQVRLSDNAVVGAEALIRWNHPERGLLQAPEFVEALIASPVALEAGRWILQSACASASSWRLAGLPPIRLGVNLFPAHFQEGELVADIETALMASGLPAEALELEITENIALDCDEEILPTLRALRDKGVGLAFDDFGTGYASLSYLTRFPLTRIKIDQSFVSSISASPSPEETAIVRSIISMGHNLGLQVVAEGVETEEQANYLRLRKCEEAQGYLYSKPLPPEEFVAFLRAGRPTRTELRATRAGG